MLSDTLLDSEITLNASEITKRGGGEEKVSMHGCKQESKGANEEQNQACVQMVF